MMMKKTCNVGMQNKICLIKKKNRKGLCVRVYYCSGSEAVQSF